MLIDLDVAPPAPRRAGRRRAIPYALVALVAGLLLLIGGAAAPSPEPALVPVLTTVVGTAPATLLTATAFYTVRTDGLSATLEARPLVDGGPAWTVETVPAQSVTPAGGTLVVEAYDTGVAAFVDARTGRTRWQVRGYPVIQVLGDRVAVWSPDSGILAMRDLTTGRGLWSLAAAAFTSDGTYVVVFDPDGGAAVHAAADGRTVTSRRSLGLRWGVGFPSPAASALVDGDRLVVYGPDFVAAFRVDGLARLWLTRTATPFDVRRCGTGLICASAEQTGLTVLDAATGAIRWNRAGRRDPTTAGDILVGSDGDVTRLDLASGRVERDFGAATPVGDVLLYADGARTWVVDRTGRVRGTLPPVTPPSACAAAGDYLACPTAGGTTTVWRVS
ncbi:outer membrane protein assembly factor BamB family protein [Actinoplanes sp. URMC 104]|uniref:outer membrane protein assembly factor BamB family protein n=1 Tax=Actinoplanes sp. URMC 104 TaxID=3423409 RepID=UPI003F1B7F7C